MTEKTARSDAPTLVDLRTAIACQDRSAEAVADLLETYMNTQYDLGTFNHSPHGLHLSFSPPADSPEAAAGLDEVLSVFFEFIEADGPRQRVLCTIGTARVHLKGPDGEWYVEEGYEVQATGPLKTELQGRVEPFLRGPSVEDLLAAYFRQF